MHKRLPLIVGVVLSILSVVLVKVYLDQQRQRYAIEVEKIKSQTQESRIPVLVANQDIPQGRAIEPAMIAVVNVASTNVPPQAVTSVNGISGMVAVVNISRGEPLTFDRIKPSGKASTASLALATPVGKRAITIPVDNISGVGGMVEPGDYVDVICIASLPSEAATGKGVKKEAVFPLFQDVLVLSRGQELPGAAAPEKKEMFASIVTLALTPEEASLIFFVQEQAKIRLVLRSPQDTKIETVPVANWEALFKYIMPEEFSKKEEQPKEEKPKEQVEIYRGLEKEVVPLSK